MEQHVKLLIEFVQNYVIETILVFLLARKSNYKLPLLFYGFVINRSPNIRENVSINVVESALLSRLIFSGVKIRKASYPS